MSCDRYRHFVSFAFYSIATATFLGFWSPTTLAVGVTPASSYTAVNLFRLKPPTGFSTFDVSGEGQFTGIGGKVVGDSDPSNGSGINEQALLWDRSGTPVDLSPSGTSFGFHSAVAFATDGIHEVGVGNADATGGHYHALLWTGTPESVVDLGAHTVSSWAYGVGGGQEVGAGQAIGGQQQALLWTGTANSQVNLHPTSLGILSSVARATDGSHQVGYGYVSNNGTSHALLWSGTASSAVDLNPTQFGAARSLGMGVSGDQQVGLTVFGAPSGFGHAVVWSGTAASYVDLNPVSQGAVQSEAVATNGLQQVGDASTGLPGFLLYAVVWTGTPDSAVNLSAFLPSNLTSSSAVSIDSAGNIYGLASDATGAQYAVEWIPRATPEPSSLLAFSAVGLLGRRFRQTDYRRRRPARL